jgi:hypothetical protein
VEGRGIGMDGCGRCVGIAWMMRFRSHLIIAGLDMVFEIS